MSEPRIGSAALAASLFAAVALYAAFLADGYALNVLSKAGIYAIAAIGYQLVFGRLGALSLAQGCFFGLGAYAAGLGSVRLGLPFPATLALGIALPVALAALVGIPVLRLASHYFALATLGIAQIALLTAVHWSDLTGGANGLYGVAPIRLPGLGTVRGLAETALVWTLVGAALALSFRLTRGRPGLAIDTLREAPAAAAALGIDGARIRYRLFLASAALGGLAGTLQAHAIGVVSPEVLEFHTLVLLLAITVIGGRHSPLGAVLGALLLVHLPEWFRAFEAYYLVAYGAALLAAVIFLPNGIAGLLGRPPRQVRDKAGAVPPRSAPRPVRLEVEGAVKRFGGLTALDGVSLALAPGEILGLIGPNGSGKTTLVNLVSGTERPDAGRIRLDGREIGGLTGDAVARAGIARTFQHAQLAESLTCREAVLAAVPADTADGEADALASELLARTGIEALAGAPAGSLPPAARKRLEIARALAIRPSVLLLDEPAAGMTEPERAALSRLLRELAAAGHGLLVIDHAMDFLLPLADRVVCLGTGRVVAEGTPAEVARNPLAIEAYFGSALP